MFGEETEFLPLQKLPLLPVSLEYDQHRASLFPTIILIRFLPYHEHIVVQPRVHNAIPVTRGATLAATPRLARRRRAEAAGGLLIDHKLLGRTCKSRAAVNFGP